MSLPLKIDDNWISASIPDEFWQDLAANHIPKYTLKCRWFGAKNAAIKRFDIILKEQLGTEDFTAYLLFVEVVFQSAYTETYFLPVSFVPTGTNVDKRWQICELTCNKQPGFLVDAVCVDHFRNYLFNQIASQRQVALEIGKLEFKKGRTLKPQEVTSQLLQAEQSNTTIVYNGNYFLKIYRKLFRDSNPDFELTQHLSERAGFKHSPTFLGSINLQRPNMYTVTLGLMQLRVENDGTAWDWMLSQVERFYGNVSRRKLTEEQIPKVPLYKPHPAEKLPLTLLDLIGIETLEHIELLAKRTAEMHLALFQEYENKNFIPINFTEDYQVWLLNRLLYQLDNRMALLENTFEKFDDRAKSWARNFLERSDEVKNRILHFNHQYLNSQRIRVHGDYHLGQVLVSSGDFVILDFEGEPESTIRDRKVKQPPLKDVAGLCRSFHYAVFATIFNGKAANLDDEFAFEAGGRYYRAIVAVFLNAYVQAAFEKGLDIGYYKEIDYLLRYHILEKAIYELGYELNSRPNWVTIPLKGIMQILNND